MSLLQMSFSGAVMIVVIVVIRALAIHKLPKRTFLALWGFAAARLLIPYSLPSAWSVYSLLRLLAPAADTAEKLPAIPFTPIAPSNAAAPVPAASVAETAAVFVDPWVAVWLTGALACAAFFAVAYFKCRREFQASLPVDNEYARQWLGEHRIRRAIEIRQSDRISAPLTYGVFRPVILMPKTADWEDRQALDYVLTHEYVHICRFDAVTKLALTAALCVHWFNLAVWMMYVLANRDIELSCDEAVIRHFGEGTKSAYAMALIRMEEVRNGLTPLCNNFSKNAIEERIIAIMKIKKTSLFSLIAAAALVVGVTAGFATSAKAEDKMPGASDSVARVSFSLNGKDYPVAPVLQDFLDRGWKQGKTVEEIGLYTEEQGVVDPVPAGYSLTSGSSRISAYLDVDSCREGLQPSVCRVRSLSLYGYNIESFCLGGKELAKTDSAHITGLLGEPNSIDENIDGKIYHYAFPGDGISEITFAFPSTLDTVAQIFLILDTDAENADGSFDPFGPLVRLEKYSQAEFDARTFVEVDSAKAQAVETTFYAFPESSEEAEETHELLKAYASFGLSHEIDLTTGELSMRWRGKPVHSVYDPEKCIWIANNMYGLDLGPDAVDLEAVYEKGKLTGLRESEFQAVTEISFAVEESTAEGNSGAADTGMSFAERFEAYAPFGITYVEAKGASGAGNVYHNGKLVSQFIDETPGGGVFSFTSARKGGITVKTVYNNSGKLTGVETVTAMQESKP